MNQLAQYRIKTDDQLRYILEDAGLAARAMKGVDDKAEAKYLDQVNDALTELYRRKNAKHLYEVGVYGLAEGRRVELRIDANTRTQAAAYVKAAGYEVGDVNMIG